MLALRSMQEVGLTKPGVTVETESQDVVACGGNLQETKRVRDPQGAYEDNVQQGDLHHLMSRPLQFFLSSTEASSFHYGVLVICAYLHLIRNFLFL